MTVALPFAHWLEARQQRARQAVERHLIEEACAELPAAARTDLSRLLEAMRYSLVGGGKHIRPVLTFAAAEAVDGRDDHPALDGAAAAVECIHAYSLIHDDLPAMDDDDLRRGRPSCHRQFDEATAILAGDALQSRAFQLLGQLPEVGDDLRVAALLTLSGAAGAQGMVGGQALDLAAVGRPISLAHLAAMHRLKTGALIRAAIRLGALIGGASPEQQLALDRYGEALGLCFQVQDDILDVVGDTTTLGKPARADQRSSKPTYPALLGLEGARHHAHTLLQTAVEAAATLGQPGQALQRLAHYVASREH